MASTPKKPKRRAVLVGEPVVSRIVDERPNPHQVSKNLKPVRGLPSMQEWWEKREGEYPFKAEAMGGVVPVAEIEEGRYGKCVSVVLKVPTRLWGFTTEAGRAAFLVDMANHKAKAI